MSDSERFPKVPPFTTEPASDEILKILLSDEETPSSPKSVAKITQEMSVGAIFEKNRELKRAKKAKKEKRF